VADWMSTEASTASPVTHDVGAEQTVAGMLANAELPRPR
jgi:hypothetical protein